MANLQPLAPIQRLVSDEQITLSAPCEDARTVRVYLFGRGAYRSRTFECRVFLPYLREIPDQFPAISLVYMMDDPSHVDLLFSRFHIRSHWSVPSSVVISETERFFQTLKQMYQL